MRVVKAVFKILGFLVTLALKLAIAAIVLAMGLAFALFVGIFSPAAGINQAMGAFASVAQLFDTDR